jgi:hypothetical protein
MANIYNINTADKHWAAFGTYQTGAVALVCGDDGFCSELTAFRDVSAFESYCSESFGDECDPSEADLDEVVLQDDGYWHDGQYRYEIDESGSATVIA